MNYGEHLSMLIALIVGLAVTELLAGASRTLKRQGEAGFSWLPFVQAGLLGTILLVFWIASYFELVGTKYLSIAAYVTQLIEPALLYFAATRVFPPAEGEGGLSVDEHAVVNARAVNIPPALWMACTIAANLYYFWPNWRGTLGPNAMCLAAGALLWVAAVTRRERLRWAATLLTEAVLVAFIAIYLPATHAP